MKTILVIDDEAQFIAVLKEMLEHAGFTVIPASDGNEGLRLFRSNPADLVITDIIMPEKEGMETIIALKKENPNIPVIAMSGGGRLTTYQYLDHAKMLGATEVLKKPFTMEMLLKAVHKCLK